MSVLLSSWEVASGKASWLREQSLPGRVIWAHSLTCLCFHFVTCKTGLGAVENLHTREHAWEGRGGGVLPGEWWSFREEAAGLGGGRCPC